MVQEWQIKQMGLGKERKDGILNLYRHTKNNHLAVFHSDEVHDRLLKDQPNFFEQEKEIFDDYPEISAKSLFDRYLENKKNGISTIVWDVIPAEQYKNLLERYMEMGFAARIPKDIVAGWYRKIRRNTVILYYLSYMYHRKYGFPFEIVPIETTSAFEAQTWIASETDFYEWAKFGKSGSFAFSDTAFNELFPLLKEYRDDMSGEEILLLINRLLHVTHWRQRNADIALAFIEGGSKTCNIITYGKGK